MKIIFNITVKYDDDYINSIIQNHKQYAIKTNTVCQAIKNVLTAEIEDLLMNYANANEVKINAYETLESNN